MSDWTVPNDVNPESGGDNVYEGFVDTDNNFTDIYTKLTALRNLRASATGSEPAGPNTNDVIHNTTDHKLYYYNGSSWVALVATASAVYDSGLTLDEAMNYYSRNMILSYDNGTDLVSLLASSNSLPATININGGLYQVTSDLTVSYNGKAAGTHYVYATTTGASGSAFVLYIGSAARDADDRKIGTLILSATSTASTISSEENSAVETAQTLYSAFCAYMSSNQNIGSNSNTKIEVDTEDFDIEGTYDNAAYTWTPTRAGYYQVNAVCNCKKSGIGEDKFTLTVRKNGSKFASGTAHIYDDDEWGGATVTIPIYMNGTGDYLELYGRLADDTGYMEGGLDSNFGRETYWSAYWLGD